MTEFTSNFNLGYPELDDVAYPETIENTIKSLDSKLKYMYGNPKDWVNLVDKGADNTGNTDIYTVLNTNQSLSDVIYFPAGTYLLDTNLTLNSGKILLFDKGAVLKFVQDDIFLTGNKTIIECGVWKIFEFYSVMNLAGTWQAKSLYIENFGAIGDDSTDCTTFFQYAIDFSSLAGIKILLQCNTYLILDTLTIKNNMDFDSVTGNINLYESHAKTTIHHNSNNENNDLFISAAPSGEDQYISGVTIKNIFINGGWNSRYCFVLTKPSYFLFENILIRNYFKEGLRINYSLNCVFNQIRIYLGAYTEGINCLHMLGDLSTTTTFSDCYLSSAYKAIIIEKGVAAGINFNNCIVESCVYGLDIYNNNVVNIVNMYTEDVPLTEVAASILQFGVNGEAELDYEKGSCNIFGGLWRGTNGTITSGSKIFEVDKCGCFNVFGVKVQRATSTISVTSNSKSVNIVGIMEEDNISNSCILTDGVKSNGVNYAGDAYNGFLYSLIGTTANRPTTGRVGGMQYFDTTIYKPIWYVGGGYWADATGNYV